MIIIAVCAIALGLWMVYVEEGFGGFIFGLVFGGMIGFMISMGAGAVIYNDDRVTEVRTVKLVSLADGSDTRGSFYLGSGTINDVSVFTWYEQNGNNSYVQGQADAWQSTVHFSQEAPHYVVKIERYEEGSFFGLWGMRLDAGDETDRHYDFFVPKGTIKSHYELDAK